MPRPHRRHLHLKNATGHVNHELHAMSHAVRVIVGAIVGREYETRGLVLDAFLIHCRNLLDFFYPLSAGLGQGVRYGGRRLVRRPSCLGRCSAPYAKLCKDGSPRDQPVGRPLDLRSPKVRPTQGVEVAGHATSQPPGRLRDRDEKGARAWPSGLVEGPAPARGGYQPRLALRPDERGDEQSILEPERTCFPFCRVSVFFPGTR